VILVALVAWASLVHPRLGGADPNPAATGTNTVTATASTKTSSETSITDATVRVDTFVTHVTATDPTGATVDDQQLPVAFSDPTVQAAIAAARALLLGEPLPTLVILDGPTLVASSVDLVSANVATVETGRDVTPIVTTTVYVGQMGGTCFGVGDLDVLNTTPCAACPACTIPAAGTPFPIAPGGVDVDTLTDTHTVIHQLQTTTNTFRTSTHYALTASLLDHFVVYTVKPTKGTPKLQPFGPVTLADAVGSAGYDVKALTALGLPANKNTEGIADSATHLARYALKAHKGAAKFTPKADVAVTNQCGSLVLTLKKPESLLVPVDTSPTVTPPVPDPQMSAVDHLLCYLAKAQTKRSDGTAVAGFPKGVQVDAVDQFQTRRYDLKKVTRLCIPVDKSGSPAVLKTGAPFSITPTAIRHPAAHLVCYAAKPAKKTIPQTGCGPVDPKSKGTTIVPPQPKHQKRTGVHVNGQLGASTLDTAKELELCIPSTATLP
jgi:hypothetical protein